MSSFVNVEGLQEFISAMQKQIDDAENMAIERLQYIGERAVKEARLHGSYTDQTGNLRSSIGYIILKDGVRVDGSQPKVYENGQDGVVAMTDLLEQLRGEYPKGLVLILCAGMNYASYVENIYHKDVLTGARLLAESLASKIFKKKYND